MDINWLSAEGSGKSNILLPKISNNTFCWSWCQSSPCFLFCTLPACFALVREHWSVYRGLLTQLTPKLLISTADPHMPFLKWGTHSTLAPGASLALPRVSSCPWLGWLLRGRVCWWSGSAPPADLVRCLAKIRSNGADTHNSATMCSSPHTWLWDLIFKWLVHITNSPRRRIKDVG